MPDVTQCAGTLMKIIAVYGETWSNTNRCFLLKYGRDTIYAMTLQIRYMHRYDVLEVNKKYITVQFQIILF